MIDLKHKPETGWNLLFALSLAGIFVAVWYLIQPPAVLSASKSEQAKIRAATRAAIARTKENLDQASAQTWELSAEALGSLALEELTKLAGDNHLQLSGLVAEKPKPVAHMDEVPFVAHCEGSFPDVAKFLKNLESPSSKYVVNMVQISSSGSSGDKVVATIGFLGFLKGGLG